MKHVGALAIVLCLALALAACGGSDGDGDETAATTSTATKATEQRIAGASALSLKDLPKKWFVAADSSDSSRFTCKPVLEARAAVSARKASPVFQHIPLGQVTHTVYLYADERRAIDAFDKLTAPKTRDCYATEFKALTAKSADGGLEAGDVTATELEIDSAGAQSSGLRIALKYEIAAQSGTLTADLVLVRVGRGVSLLTLADEMNPIDAKLRGRLVTTMVRKLDRALASS